jgi:DNA repair protein RadA/Sms
MAKTKTSFFCQNCGYQSAKWVGKCPSCNEWNSFAEEVVVKEDTTKKIWQGDTTKSTPALLDEINSSYVERFSSKNTELDRVLGGGLVPGSLVLIGGEPGIGKSTLMLQLSLKVNKKVLYVSGEESEQQIKLRAERITAPTKDSTWILSETDLDQIFQQTKAIEPELIIVDSIQTLTSKSLESVAGSVGQVRHCAGELLRYAKQTNVPVILVGHITKDGALAGPKVLEHMVDTVLQFEGDARMMYRLLRTTKNRYGSTAELGIYEMTGEGLRNVDNPSEILISQRDTPVSGVSIGATIEGNRSLMIEIQSLVGAAAYGTPQRTSTGFDAKRLNMLLAVLEKRTGLKLGTQDVFVNMAGGIRVDDPAVDLAVCVAVLSSLHDISISDKACFAAEVGLGGEVRAVNRIESRIAEAEKLGFETIYISKYNKNINKQFNSIKVKSFGLLPQIFGDLFG